MSEYGFVPVFGYSDQRKAELVVLSAICTKIKPDDTDPDFVWAKIDSAMCPKDLKDSYNKFLPKDSVLFLQRHKDESAKDYAARAVLQFKASHQKYLDFLPAHAATTIDLNDYDKTFASTVDVPLLAVAPPTPAHKRARRAAGLQSPAALPPPPRNDKPAEILEIATPTTEGNSRAHQRLGPDALQAAPPSGASATDDSVDSLFSLARTVADEAKTGYNERLAQIDMAHTAKERADGFKKACKDNLHKALQYERAAPDITKNGINLAIIILDAAAEHLYARGKGDDMDPILTDELRDDVLPLLEAHMRQAGVCRQRAALTLLGTALGKATKSAAQSAAGKDGKRRDNAGLAKALAAHASRPAPHAPRPAADRRHAHDDLRGAPPAERQHGDARPRDKPPRVIKQRSEYPGEPMFDKDPRPPVWCQKWRQTVKRGQPKECVPPCSDLPCNGRLKDTQGAAFLANAVNYIGRGGWTTN